MAVLIVILAAFFLEKDKNVFCLLWELSSLITAALYLWSEEGLIQLCFLSAEVKNVNSSVMFQSILCFRNM